MLRRLFWGGVVVANLFILLFLFGPPSVQKSIINAIYSVLQKEG